MDNVARASATGAAWPHRHHSTITFDIPKIKRCFQYNVRTQFSFKSGREDGGYYLVRMKIERITDPPPVRKLRR